eukprot:CAMPEP_0182445028 /NCGR_PEP_ID=MMETSP1172-20130603/3293_1 /TAXON_ID=708627 /ORGANISM="Timspurckia oligopyrenoides, Strain CCMP3278" /LENGTH=522 /DNA_ID=CAMNT_0024640723 /DNA_START=50 /DNA_END=1618 /DNA_ORIENTATION=+
MKGTGFVSVSSVGSIQISRENRTCVSRSIKTAKSSRKCPPLAVISTPSSSSLSFEDTFDDDSPTVSLVALGCAKNTVDAEVMLGDLERNGVKHVEDPADADVIIVNTCGFIEQAKQSSLEAILEVAQLKSVSARGLIVTGCMAQRYASELAAELPEVDAIVGFENYSAIPETVLRLISEKSAPTKASRVLVGGPTVPFRPESLRTRLTPKHTAFLRVAEGCDHACTFCAIPGFRGKFRSKPWDDLILEAQHLADSGVRELNLIAEDTNQYGTDFGSKDKRRLDDLLYALAEIDGIKWIRLLYCYPSYFSENLVKAIADIPKVVKYIDIPLQHISDKVLKAMNRPSKDHTLKILQRLRTQVETSEQSLTLRTTFISGFPGETAADHRELVDFLKEFKFVRAGVFSYSAEEGTAAAILNDELAVDEETMRARFDEITSVQQEIEENYAKSKIGSIVEVIVDRIEDGHSIARTMFDAPDIDSIVHVVQEIEPGSILPVRIVGTHAFDLIADSNLHAEIDQDETSQ